MDTAPPNHTASPTIAPEPFNGRDHADVILRSSDQYDFHVHKVVLILASPFFKEMFTLSQPTNPLPPTLRTLTDALPIIPVSEDHDTIEYLLRLCYPIADPVPAKDAKAVATILEAAIKYDLEEAIDILKSLLLRFVPTEPLQVYAHACRLRLEHEASEAAKQWREQISSKRTQVNSSCQNNHHVANSSTVTPCVDYDCVFKSFRETALGSTWVDDMVEIPAGCLYRLVRFVKTGEASGFCHPPIVPVASPSPSDIVPPPSEDSNFLDHCPRDIILKSWDGKLVWTYRTFLAFAGADALLNRACSPLTSPLEIPIVDFDADEATIRSLLRFCEPLAADMAHSENVPPEDFLRVWNVAKTYGMKKVMDVVRSNWAKRIEEDPLQSYLTAMRYGWSVEAQKAATYSMSLPLFDGAGHVPEMELVSAKFIRDLYQFQHDHRKARTTVLEKARCGFGSPRVTSTVSKAATLPLIFAPLLSHHMSSKTGRHPNCHTSGAFHSYACCAPHLWNKAEEEKLLKRSNELLQEVETATSSLRVGDPAPNDGEDGL